jgi:hypothetical protein
MAQNAQKSTILDDLATMINGGFYNMQKQIDAMKGTMKDIVEDLNATHEDVRYLRRSVDMPVRNGAAQDAAVNSLTARVARSEKKIRLAN